REAAACRATIALGLERSHASRLGKDRAPDLRLRRQRGLRYRIGRGALGRRADGGGEGHVHDGKRQTMTAPSTTEGCIRSLLADELRPAKPRTFGLTMMIDKGQMGPNSIAAFAAVSGAHCDYVKLAWGSALITGNLLAKLECYRKGSITPLFGGSLFEYA